MLRGGCRSTSRFNVGCMRAPGSGPSFNSINAQPMAAFAASLQCVQYFNYRENCVSQVFIAHTSLQTSRDPPSFSTLY